MNWTKGKWQVVTHVDGGKTVQNSERYLVATVAEYDADTAKHAHLIAAAPELYEALSLFVPPYQDNQKYTDMERMDKAKAALAKARGEV